MAIVISILSIVIAMLSLGFSIYVFIISDRDKRIEKVVDRFFAQKEGDNQGMRHLIPAGIADLKNDKEIEEALTKIKNRLGIHPLRSHNIDVAKIGYKRFFECFNREGIKLNKGTIGEAISSFLGTTLDKDPIDDSGDA